MQQDTERETFEAWASDNQWSLSCLADKVGAGAPRAGEYRHTGLQDAWETWQAALRQGPQPRPDHIEDVRGMVPSRDEDALIDAAEAHAALYDGDPRDCIATDVMNAFYAGAAFIQGHPASSQQVESKTDSLHVAVNLAGPESRVAPPKDASNHIREATPDEECLLMRKIAAQQAYIDALMLEYCPDEMTPEQVEEWGKHQRRLVEPVPQAHTVAVPEDPVAYQVRHIDPVEGPSLWCAITVDDAEIYRTMPRWEIRGLVPAPSHEAAQALPCMDCGSTTEGVHALTCPEAADTGEPAQEAQEPVAYYRDVRVYLEWENSAKEDREGHMRREWLTYSHKFGEPPRKPDGDGWIAVFDRAAPAVSAVPVQPSEEQVAEAARVLSESSLIHAPKLPPECWHGLARRMLAGDIDHVAGSPSDGTTGVVSLPKTAEQVIAFIGSNFHSMDMGDPTRKLFEDKDNCMYCLSVHDLLSAFDELAQSGCSAPIGDKS